MNGVITASALLKDTVLSQDQTELLHIITHASEALLRVINDILDYSKIDANKMVIIEQVVDVRDLVTSVVRSFSTSKQVSLTTSISEQVPKYVTSDCARLYQVLNNLVHNAVKFTELGSIEVKVWFETSEQGGVIFCAVKDTGTGMNQTLKCFART
jgi:signal transduction histidine kinase